MNDGVFHRHLDTCKQCTNHPFGLCPVGARLIEEEALGQKHEIADVQYTAPEILCGATAHYAGGLVACTKTREPHRWHIADVRVTCFPPTGIRVRWETGASEASPIP